MEERAQSPQWCDSVPPTILLFYDYLLSYLLFIFGCAGSSLLHGLSLVTASEGYSLLQVHGLLIEVPPLVLGLRL